MYLDTFDATGNTQQSLSQIDGVGGFFPSIKGISFSLGLKERHYYNGTAVLEGFLADADY